MMYNITDYCYLKESSSGILQYQIKSRLHNNNKLYNQIKSSKKSYIYIYSDKNKVHICKEYLMNNY